MTKENVEKAQDLFTRLEKEVPFGTVVIFTEDNDDENITGYVCLDRKGNIRSSFQDNGNKTIILNKINAEVEQIRGNNMKEQKS